jgi:SAM-dependent methyltransferase
MQPNVQGASKDWYKDFFQGVALDMWRRAIPPQMTEAEAGFLAEVFPSGGRILDVPCGNGRHSIALAKRGFKVTGVDLSEEFITEARREAKQSAAAEFLHTDMRELPWQSEFDGACCLGNSFNYLDYAGTIAFLAAVSKSLKPGGRFVIDTGCSAESLLPKLQERGWMELGDILFLSSRRYDAAESRLEIEYTFVRDGVADKRKASSAVYTVAETRRMLEQTGFATKSLFGGFDKSQFELGSPRLVIVAESKNDARFQSCRSAIIGSTREARNAGK